jgi:outer membrane protein insertion porin family
MMKMRRKIINYITLLVAALFALSCSNTRYLPEGDMLYTGGEVTVKDTIMGKKERKALQKELEPLLRPKPNSNFLGLRFKLYIYNVAGVPKKDRGFKHWLRTKVGEPPVLFSQVDLDYNADILQNYSENKGFFKAKTSADSTSRNRRAKAMYTVTTGRQFKIRNVIFPDSTGSPLEKAIGRTKRRTLLKSGDPCDLATIKAERERIDDRLKNRGFYYFKPDYILARADSTVGKYQVDVKLIVKEDTPEEAKNIYKIDNIIIYPNYSLTNNQDSVRYAPEAVVKYKDFTIIDSAHTFRPIIYDKTLFFHKGDIYSRRDHNLSLNRLINLGTFKFVKNEFQPSDSLKNGLDAIYYFTPLPKKSIRIETLGKTNSANYNGSEVSVNWRNRNTFRGAELLTAKVFGGLEIQVAGQNKGYNVYRVGGETSLIWPRFITPFKIKDSTAYVPRTKALLSYEYQKRIKLYALNSFRAQFGYLWKDNIRSEHELYVSDVNYISPASVTQEYIDQINGNEAEGIAPNPALQKVIDKQLIFGPTYSYTYTNTMRKQKKHTFYYKGTLELAGTLTGLAMGADVKGGNEKTILNVPFSQFAKTEQDFRHYLKLTENSQIASRINIGIGVPYGNSASLPYVRQFFIGGVNSIRAFRARSIGPGSYDYRTENNTTSGFLPDESGDLKLELNTEYRAQIYRFLKGAIFVDAGNIWLYNKDPLRPGAEFSAKFMNDLAVGTGAGLRFDFSFLILRTDLAFPLRKPWLPDGEKWVTGDIDFGSSTWRKDNLVFNLAIGYPF